ncbi:hypothetical protein [Bacillus sp. FSL R5-0439]|uniref:hypothetical protein n=1 Tax=Bacillus sp. FSL R5-0439 TaxID=2954586 RepID=UPI0030FBF0CA
MAEQQEGQRIQRFPELDTIIDMVNWWIVWINNYSSYIMSLKREWGFMVINKKIGIGHFVYNIIIALLIITFTLVLAFGSDKDAGNQVNVMATGISIILAVIAILMTLVDVAGQRQSIVDIRETAEKLAESQSVSQDTIQKLKETLEELIDFRQELLKSVSDYRNGTEELIQGLFKKEEQSISREELDELLIKLNKKTSDLDTKIAKGESIRIIPEKVIINDFKYWVRKKYENQEKIDIISFLNEINRNFSSRDSQVITVFIKYKHFTYYDTQEEGEYVDLEAIKKVEYTGTGNGFKPII